MVLYTDESFIREISQGNKAAFDQLFRESYVLLRNYALKIVKDITLAEDIVQDTFFNLWIKHEQFSTVRNIRAYIKTAVHNEAISALRKNKLKNLVIDSTTILEFEKLYAEIIQYQDTYTDRDLAQRIGTAIDHLPEHCRSIFVLSRSFGFKNKEIADQLNISVKAVEKQITRALSFLREELKDYLMIFILYFFA